MNLTEVLPRPYQLELILTAVAAGFAVTVAAVAARTGGKPKILKVASWRADLLP